MKQRFEIIFNNGELRQILMLPETPMKIIFLFPEKELILREKLNKNGLYVISHHRGFQETDAESDQELVTSQNEEFEKNEKHSDLTISKNVIFKRSEELSKLSVKRQDLSSDAVLRFPNFINIGALEVVSNGNYIISGISPATIGISNGGEDNINALKECPITSANKERSSTPVNKECLSAPVINNKSNQICSNKTKQGVKSSNLSPINRKTLTKCSFCLKWQKQPMSRFPTCGKLSDLWARASGRKWLINATCDARYRKYRVCGDHFKESDYKPGSNRLQLGAVPTQNLPKSSKTSISQQLNTNFLDRLKSKLQIALHKSDEPENTSLQKTVGPSLISPHVQNMTNQEQTFQPSNQRQAIQPFNQPEESITSRFLNRPVTDIHCCVEHCTSSKSKNPECTFHNFPPENVFYSANMYNILVSINLREEWTKVLQIRKPVTSEMQVCSCHFQKSDFVSFSKPQTPQLKKYVIPTQNLPVPLV